MLCCAHGAEQAVKSEISRDGWRLAFSRPGFVTCKHDDSKTLPHGVFIRTASQSIGQCRDSNGRQQIAKLIESLEVQVHHAGGNFEGVELLKRIGGLQEDSLGAAGQARA